MWNVEEGDGVPWAGLATQGVSTCKVIDPLKLHINHVR